MLTHGSTPTSTGVPVFPGQIGGQPATVCDARALHQALGAGRDFSTWMKERIDSFGFVENADYQVFTENGENPKGGRPATGYLISIDMAKELAMVERSDQGKAIRRYFIDCERKLASRPQITLPQLLAAQKHSLQLVKAIKAEANPSIKAMIHGQLSQVCLVLGTPAPALDVLSAVAIGDVDSKALADFWDAYQKIGPAALNHSHDSSKIAINFNQFEQLAKEKGIALPPKDRLQRALRESQDPKFIDVKSVASRINTERNAEGLPGIDPLPTTMKCWVFEKVGG